MKLFFTDLMYSQNMINYVFDFLTNEVNEKVVCDEDIIDIQLLSKSNIEKIKSFHLNSQEYFSTFEDGIYRIVYDCSNIFDYFYVDIEECTIKSILLNEEQYTRVDELISAESEKQVQVFERVGDQIFLFINQMIATNKVDFLEEVHMGYLLKNNEEGSNIYEDIIKIEETVFDDIFSAYVPLVQSCDLDDQESYELE